MRLSDESLPKLIAAGVTLLVAPILWTFLDSSDPEVDPSSQEAAAEEVFGAPGEIESEVEGLIPLEEIAPILDRISTAPPEGFQNIIVPERLDSYSPEAIDAIIAGLEYRLSRDPGSSLLEVEAQVVRHAIRRLVTTEDPGVTLLKLRQRAMTAGGVERFASVAERLFREPRLARWLAEHDRTDPGWILDSAVLLEDPSIVAEWGETLLWETGRHAPSLDLAAEWIRSLAYFVGRTGDERSRALLEATLEVESLAARPGATPGTARRIALWLRSVAAIASIEKQLEGNPNRASTLDELGSKIEAAVLGMEAVLRTPDLPDRSDAGLPARLQRRAILDLTRGRLAAARIQERRTALPPMGTLESRTRKLLRIGMNSLDLEDHTELAHVIELLERSRAEFFHQLLSAARARVNGADRGREAILATLADDAARSPEERFLYPAEVEDWRRFADRGRFAVVVDTPALRFESGKLWAELGPEGRTWLDRTLEDLRTELHQKRDLAYLTFLEARVALGEGRSDGFEERLLGLLDDGPPPGLGRAEIGALLVLCEERASQLAGAKELRRLIVSGTTPLDAEAAYDPLPSLVGSILRFRSDRDLSPLESYGDPDVVRRLDEFEDVLTGGAGLTFDLAIERLRLAEELFAAGSALADQGHLDLAGDLYDRVTRWVGTSPDLWAARGELERTIARSLEEDDPDTARERWLAASFAFHRAAQLDPSRMILLVDATRAAIAGGELDEAAEIIEIAGDTFANGRADDSLQWEAIVLGIEIERRRGEALLVVDSTRRAIDEKKATSPIREILYLDQAWGYEQLGDDSAALETLDIVRHSLGTASPYWKRAVYERARLLEKQLTGRDDLRSRDALTRAREAWGEAASWLTPTTGSADLAIACLHAAEHSMALDEPADARRYLETLFASEDAFLSAEPRRVERERWDLVTERALYTLGDLHRASGRPDLARETYEDAIDRYPGSTRVPVGFLMLGMLAEDRGEPDEALGLYRRGVRKAEAVGPDLAREPYFDVKEKLEARIRRIESTR